MVITLGVAFSLGLASTLHCWGMCGGILAAFTLGLPAAGSPHGHSFRYLAGFNIGRILSYAIAGAAAGLLGAAAVSLPWRAVLFPALQVLAGAAIIAAGLRLGGWLRPGGLLERAGARAWLRIQPVCRAFIPVNTLPRALGLGMLWGWMPCGLVYASLAWSAASASAVDGAALMSAFGLGTLPGMLAAGLAGSQLHFHLRALWVRQALAGLLIMFGVLGPGLSWYLHDAGHAQHRNHLLSR